MADPRRGSGPITHRLRSDATLRAAVLQALAGGPLRREEIAVAIEAPLQRVAPCLTKMKHAGMVRHTGRKEGLWSAVPAAEWPASRGRWSKPGRRGAQNPRWKGGRYQNREGYILINVGRGAPMADKRGYAYEHRLVAAQAIGHPIPSHIQVHHVDENRGHNAPSNLEPLRLADHKVRHRIVGLNRQLPGEENPIIQCDCGCGASLFKFDQWKRPRRFLSGHARRTRTA